MNKNIPPLGFGRSDPDRLLEPERDFLSPLGLEEILEALRGRDLVGSLEEMQAWRRLVSSSPS